MEKKRFKSQIVAEKQSGVKCCSEPTKNIVVCNSGLSNGFSEEDIITNFANYGHIDNIVMLPNKSCCFFSYISLEDAVNAYSNTNGKLKIAQDNKPIYLAFCNSLPACETFSTDKTPPGLKILEEFITQEQENMLLSLINQEDQEDTVGSLKHRRVWHFGYEFNYETNNVDRDKPLEKCIPEVCSFLSEKLKTNGIFFSPDQLTVNSYNPGQGIPHHVDTHSAFEDPLMSLSLNSDVVMEFRHKNGRNLPVLLPRRSLAIMSGESRYDWLHGITPRKYDIVPSKNGLTVRKRETRISFTFRKIRSVECNCPYTDLCDSFKKKVDLKINNNEASRLESQFVHSVYENIANHFSATRHKPWPNVENFIKSFKVGSVLVDVGCGNGKYLGSNLSIFNVGCDASSGLLNICKERQYQVFCCNCLNVPLKDGIADAVISIAVIHHLASKERRLKAIEEIIRLLSVKGQALIYVWAKNQSKTNKSSYLKQDRKNRKVDSEINTMNQTKVLNVTENISLPVHTNRKQFQQQDVFVPWKTKDENSQNEFLRYYHVFEEGELLNICSQFKNVVILRSYYDDGNWCVLLEKK